MEKTEAAIIARAMQLNDAIEVAELRHSSNPARPPKPLDLPPEVRAAYERLRDALAADGLIRC